VALNQEAKTSLPALIEELNQLRQDAI